MQPNILIIAHFAVRGMLLWVGARLLAGAVIAFAGGDPLFLDVSSAVVLVASCIAVGLADAAPTVPSG